MNDFKKKNLRAALETLTETTIWGETIITAPRPGCADYLIEALFGLVITRYASGDPKTIHNADGKKLANNYARVIQHVDLTSEACYPDPDIEWKNRPYVELGEAFLNHPCVLEMDLADREDLLSILEFFQLDKYVDNAAAVYANAAAELTDDHGLF